MGKRGGGGAEGCIPPRKKTAHPLEKTELGFKRGGGILPIEKDRAKPFLVKKKGGGGGTSEHSIKPEIIEGGGI